MLWSRSGRVHLVGLTFFFVFEFLFNYPRVLVAFGLPLPVYVLICAVFAAHLWWFNYAIVQLVHRVYTGQHKKLRSRLFAFLCIIPVSVLLTTAFQSLFFSWLNNRHTALNFYVHYEDVGMNLLYSLIIIFFLEQLYYFRSWTQALTESAALRQQSVETQLDALRSQVNPHFLFNSLNSLSALILSNPAQAVTFVHKLSGVYRYLLQSNDRHLVTLEEELDFLKAYLHLLQTRFGQALQFTLKVDPVCAGLLIPPLTLQLLVENAVKHNIVAVEQPLSLVVFTEGERLLVQNNLQRKRTHITSHQFGLANLCSRYRLMTDAPVTIAATDDSFLVNLPLLKTNRYEGADHRG